MSTSSSLMRATPCPPLSNSAKFGAHKKFEAIKCICVKDAELIYENESTPFVRVPFGSAKIEQAAICSL